MLADRTHYKRESKCTSHRSFSKMRRPSLYGGRGSMRGTVASLVSQLQHFHWCFFPLQPGKRSKEQDVEKMFKLSEGQCGRSPRIFPLTAAGMEKAADWQPGDGCSVVMQRHGIAQSFNLQKNSSSQVEILHFVLRKYANTFRHTHTHTHTHTHARATADGNINFLLKIPMRLCVV